MNPIKITMESSVFGEVQKFLADSIHCLMLQRIEPAKMVIYAPAYFMRMHEAYLIEKINFRSQMPINRFMNVQIVDNYENTIVVAPKDIHQMDLQPLIFKL